MTEKYSLFRGKTYFGGEAEDLGCFHVTIISSADENVDGMVVVERDSNGFRIETGLVSSHAQMLQNFIDKGAVVTEEFLQPGELIRLEETDGELITYHTIAECQLESGERVLQVEKQSAKAS